MIEANSVQRTKRWESARFGGCFDCSAVSERLGGVDVDAGDTVVQKIVALLEGRGRQCGCFVSAEAGIVHAGHVATPLRSRQKLLQAFRTAKTSANGNFEVDLVRSSSLSWQR
jgi:hypothetical protein